VHHRSIQIDHQPDATIFQFIILTFICSSTCFGRSPTHHQELNDCSSSLWYYLRIVVLEVLCSWSARPRIQHDCHHDTKVKPEAATAVVELLMMGGRTPETCWAVNKRQVNKLKNCCIWLVIYLNYTKGSGRDQIEGTLYMYAWEYWEKLRKSQYRRSASLPSVKCISDSLHFKPDCTSLTPVATVYT
jgi:hypothetical protein